MSTPDCNRCRAVVCRLCRSRHSRHTCAMLILQATGDLRKVSLWLGHADMQTTEVYLRADPTEKIAALESIMPPALRRGQFTVPDKLIASLRGECLWNVIGASEACSIGSNHG